VAASPLFTGRILEMDRPVRTPLSGRLTTAIVALLTLVGVTGIARSAWPAQTDTPYQITDGKVDKRTFNGFRRYNAVCNHCHGLDGAGGSFGRSLVDAPLPRAEFRDAVLAGRASGNFVMKGYADDPNVAPFVDDIYAYLRARSDGAIGRGRPAVAE
jgi:mono/diheme cytochrome c family protein